MKKGAVSLWEWSPRATLRPTIDQLQVAVKTTISPTKDLEEEGDMMMSLRRVKSEHIAKILSPPRTLTRADCAREGIDAATWEGRITRLIMEYYHHGSLRDLKVRRRSR